ncbi:MAG TPA: sigma-70 family RNA polymerase sigma factor [Kofleriaceae bacterium]|nr:sigma-70 family RNA polymerase sigma factor [Kofleriaceae bacterium]
MVNTPARSAAPEAPREDADIEQLIERGQYQDAVKRLMERYGERVYRFAHAMTRNAAQAEDVRQQVFIEAFRDFARFERRSSLRTWLFGIVRHRCLDASKIQRRWWRRFKNDPPDEPELEPPDLDQSRIARLLHECLAKLAPRAREAVVLRYIEELAYEQAAEITGELAGTLQQRVGRALPVLRRCVDSKLRDRPANGGSHEV